MSSYTYDSHSARIGLARFNQRVTSPLRIILLVSSLLCTGAGLALLVTHHHHSLIIIGLGLVLLSKSLWISRSVSKMVPQAIGSSQRLEQILPPELLPGFSLTMNYAQIFTLTKSLWETRFVIGRLGLPVELLETALLATTSDLDTLIDEASRIAVVAGADELSIEDVVGAILSTSEPVKTLLTATKLDTSDIEAVVGWVSRLKSRSKAERPAYGGLGRDWAAGYTPTLNQFAQNFSRQIEDVRGRFSLQERTIQLDALLNGIAGAAGSVVLVGETGIGKTALLYGLADLMLRGETGPTLRHYQVVSLSAASMMARVQQTGDLERIVLSCLGEAISAGNIVVALDEAQLFFGQGAGAVNLSQLLLPIVQGRQLKLVLTLTSGDWQALRSTNAALSSLLTPIILTEPTTKETLDLLADRALNLESAAAFSYQALKRANSLGERYVADEANPGRSLKLLEASLAFPQGDWITAASVEKVVESQFGVKVEQATATETDTLIHLEDKIHERMINQTRAVGVVASALRRARAGVSNPKRPIGSFLFLGPTGVGKTELAKSLAAIYFGSEKNLIRLDMSEYQQPSDVTRLLASAAENPDGLLPKVKQQPFSVVLFDEIEKANPNILNLLLQLLDEGNLTDSANRGTSFKDAIIIATSNAGADEIRRHIEAGEVLESFEQEFTDTLISSGSFKPELLNRFDEIVLFRPLNELELVQVVGLLIREVNMTLAPQKVTVELTPAATTALVRAGYDPRLGARPMRRMVQRTVEDAVAGKILRGEAPAGTTIKLDIPDLNLRSSLPASS